ncbi:MAG: DUF2142 domain-containing protein [Actinomycetota bacterium]
MALVWSFATPLMHAPDEWAHAVRAAAVWDGTLHGRDQRTESRPAPDGSVVRGTMTHVTVPSAYMELRTMSDCYMFKPEVPATCAPPVSSDETAVPGYTYVGTYQPTYYLLVGWPTRLLDPRAALYAMRAVSAVIGGALLGLGIASAHRCGRSHLLLAGAALAATPQALFLIGVVNPSGLEIAAAFATVLGLLELVRGHGPPSRALLAQVAGSAALLAATRPLSPLLLAVLVAADAHVGLTRHRWRELVADRAARHAALSVGVVTSAASAWVVSTHAYDAFTGISIPGLSPGAAARQHVELLGFRTRQLVGYFGTVDTPLPEVAIWSWVLATALLVAASVWMGRWLQRAAVVGLLAVAMLLPLASEVSRAATYGFIWQGRYGLPIVVGLPILSAWVVADRSGDRLRTVARRWLPITLGVAMAAAHVVAHLTYMTRVVVGRPNPWWRYLTAEGWRPPIPVAVLLAAAVASASAFGAVLALSRRPDPAVRAADPSVVAAGRR